MTKNKLSGATLAIFSLLFLSSCSFSSEKTNASLDSQGSQDISYTETAQDRRKIRPHHDRGFGSQYKDSMPTISGSTYEDSTSLSMSIATDEDTVSENIASIVGKTIKKSISYAVPGQTIATEFVIGVSEEGAITSISASTASRDRHDQQYHARFNNAISTVVGKKISDLTHLASVGGASLTTEAFNIVIESL